MAEFLTTSAITFQLEEIIKDAKEELVLISPYLKFNARIRDYLEDKIEDGKDNPKLRIRIVYGKKEPNPQEKDWLNSRPSMETSFRENLHAKCYLNESKALVTSMNLYEFSQQNNDEMGILVSRECDPELYSAIRIETDRIERRSQEVQRRSIARRPFQPTRMKDRTVAPSHSALEPADVESQQVYATGDKVRHATFGTGLVVRVQPSGTETELVVKFDGGAGIKCLLARFAPMERVSDSVLS